MKSHQIVLLGGQIIPAYIGIKERKPDVIHILYTKESVYHRKRLEKIISNCKVNSYQVSPYDYNSISETVTQIICDYEGNKFELNLTGGTKLMALASQEVFRTLDCFSFYIDQNQNFIDIASGIKHQITFNLKTKEFLALSGHDEIKSSSLKSFTLEEKELAKHIFELRKKRKGLSKLFKLFRALRIDSGVMEYHFNNKEFNISWQNNRLTVDAPKFNLRSKGDKVFKILTTGLWWEIIVAESISSWRFAYETYMSFIIKSNSNSKLDKNEIDILINTGQKLLFIECKSGRVNQSDINKMRAIGKFYGGISSKSILISFFKPIPQLIEKCQDFGIELFYFEEKRGKHINLKSISKKLDLMLSKLEL